MTSRDFAYWLQGYFEIKGMDGGGLSAAQVEIIKRHLALVFKHEIDPSFPAEQQEALNEIHRPKNEHLFKPQKPGETLIRC